MTTRLKDTVDALRYPTAWAGHVLDRPEPDLEDVMTSNSDPANDNPEVSPPSISLTDLATALNLDEDALIERIGNTLLRRDIPPDDTQVVEGFHGGIEVVEDGEPTND
jgi:hypothetical protein